MTNLSPKELFKQKIQKIDFGRDPFIVLGECAAAYALCNTVESNTLNTDLTDFAALYDFYNHVGPQKFKEIIWQQNGSTRKVREQFERFLFIGC